MSPLLGWMRRLWTESPEGTTTRPWEPKVVSSEPLPL
jgi:hypothetical protein